tara:strand:- start:121 stop:327 length:207 start_codon:yes stop_codon:yes gene_type:complete
MILIQEYKDKILIDNWYLKDTTYPGTLLFFDYEKALKQAKSETYSRTEGDKHFLYKATVILCQHERTI